MKDRAKVAIYRDHLLPSSETFIHSQGECLKKFQAYYVGSRRVDGLHLPEERIIVLNKHNSIGWIRESLFKLTGYSPSMVNELLNINPVLLHAHFGYGGTTALPLVQQLNIPLLVTFHGVDVTTTDEFARKSFYGHRVYLRKRNKLKREASMFIAVSNFIKNKILEQGFPEEKIVQHYIGIDINKFQPDPLIQRENIVLFVGRLVEKKGCEYLIRAMELIQKEITDARLVIIGDGPLRLNLEALAQKKLKHYHFLGGQPQSVVSEWMNRAKIFSVPSVVAESGDAEGFGMVFAEANAMGVPVSSFSSGGIPEAIKHGETGLLAKEKDWQALASNTIRLLKEEELWNKFSTASQYRVGEMFNITEQGRKLEDIYQKVISKHKYATK